MTCSFDIIQKSLKLNVKEILHKLDCEMAEAIL